MQDYAAGTRDRMMHSKTERQLDMAAPSAHRQRKAAQAERYQVLVRRKQEDALWRAASSKHRQAVREWRALCAPERRQQHAPGLIEDQSWHALRAQRQVTLAERERENEAWHERVKALRSDTTKTTGSRRWLAILVVTDNCTRQCYGLPLFRTGPKLTARDLVDALRELLPSELAYFISDQGAHFRTKAFAELNQDVGFAHVPVYRHRPQTNGIAERFVRTLKEWLATKAWGSCEALGPLLSTFIPEYNNRPHQGVSIPGLSPNEFARRIWLL